MSIQRRTTRRAHGSFLSRLRLNYLEKILNHVKIKENKFIKVLIFFVAKNTLEYGIFFR
jgi:hypothetical protein